MVLVFEESSIELDQAQNELLFSSSLHVLACTSNSEEYAVLPSKADIVNNLIN